MESLNIPGEHLVSVHGKEHPVRASSLKVGDALVRADGSSQRLRPLVPLGAVERMRD